MEEGKRRMSSDVRVERGEQTRERVDGIGAVASDDDGVRGEDADNGAAAF